MQKNSAVDEFYLPSDLFLGRGRLRSNLESQSCAGRFEIVSTFIPEYEFPRLALLSGRI